MEAPVVEQQRDPFEFTKNNKTNRNFASLCDKDAHALHQGS